MDRLIWILKFMPVGSRILKSIPIGSLILKYIDTENDISRNSDTLIPLATPILV